MSSGIRVPRLPKKRSMKEKIENLWSNYRELKGNKVTPKKLAKEFHISVSDARQLKNAASDGYISPAEYSKMRSEPLKKIAKYHQEIGWRSVIAQSGAPIDKKMKMWLNELKGAELFDHVKSEITRGGAYMAANILKNVKNWQLDTMKPAQRSELARMIKDDNIYRSLKFSKDLRALETVEKQLNRLQLYEKQHSTVS